MSKPAEQSGFTIRAVLIAIGLSIFLLASSTYIAIQLGALPWPIIFSVIVSGGLLKLLQRSGTVNIHEVNVAQAGASIGGLLAAGLAFTIPGILFLNKTRGLEIPWPDPWLLALLTAAAGSLGILLSIPLKRTFIDEEQLPYPAGTAGAELLKLGKAGGQQLALIMLIGAVAALFALSRDTWFPGGYTIEALTGMAIYITLLPLPLAVGSGYILGPRAGFSWFGGALVGWIVIIPILAAQGMDFAEARGLIQNLGMGIVLGSGIGFFAGYVLPRLKRLAQNFMEARGGFIRLLPLVLLIAIGALLALGVNWLATALTVIGVVIMVPIAARMTGETNINPLEQFGIFVGLVIALLYQFAGSELGFYAAFMIVTFVSVACAIAGDAGHDYKSAALIGTRFSDIIKVDLITVICASLAAPFVLEIIRISKADVLFTAAMPAPQAQLVAGSISGFDYPMAFAAGFAMALVAELVTIFLPKKVRQPVLIMPLGIGLFLGPGLAIPLAIGAALRSHIDKRHAHLYLSGLLIAAGIMGGEGIAGFGNAALTVALPAVGLDEHQGVYGLLVLFALVSLWAVFVWRKSVRSTR